MIRRLACVLVLLESSWLATSLVTTTFTFCGEVPPSPLRVSSGSFTLNYTSPSYHCLAAADTDTNTPRMDMYGIELQDFEASISFYQLNHYRDTQICGRTQGADGATYKVLFLTARFVHTGSSHVNQPTIFRFFFPRRLQNSREQGDAGHPDGGFDHADSGYCCYLDTQQSTTSYLRIKKAGLVRSPPLL